MSKSKRKPKPLLIVDAARRDERRAALRKVFDDLDAVAQTRCVLRAAARWQAFGVEIGYSPHSIERWAKAARVPYRAAMVMRARYGVRVDVDYLTDVRS